MMKRPTDNTRNVNAKKSAPVVHSNIERKDFMKSIAAFWGECRSRVGEDAPY
jgi:hypothetical protein